MLRQTSLSLFSSFFTGTSDNPTPTASEIAATIKIQAAARGFLTRRKYKIDQLDYPADYEAFLVGNDPKMPPALDQYHEPNEKIALIATSGLRALSLACKLGNPAKTPKIFLVDNSHQVTRFWRAFIKFMEHKDNNSKENFLQNLPYFLNHHLHLYRDLPSDACTNNNTADFQYLNQDPRVFLTALINKYGYQYVRSVALHTSVITASWTDPLLFTKLSNILRYLEINKIFMYPSNIAACLHDRDDIDVMLNNIASLSPALSIHTDCCPTHGVPEKVILAEDQTPDTVFRQLFGERTAASGYRTISVDFETFLMLSMLLRGTQQNEFYESNNKCRK